ncbi:GDYXXLXY domain-containing protein [Brevibacillus humidisoli]|uniref:GDYXXLXY domain-containing protein n=1 Tax=Brevibacillus humidisoli TaxID=2895522 RepID=UPI001E49E06F|nr:GDYXXLXY domain-containing protein [Brevibacillus humidisoli]UFJ43051.1 GDYXXLXY domain-containing protein [Brevibacillus humidisoli]
MSKRFVLLVLLQVLMLLSVVGKYYWISTSGHPVTLKTAPVDPRDLFYGDYVRLGFEISRIDLQSVQHDLEEPLYDTDVYVVLEQKGNVWHEAVGVYRHKPQLAPGQIMLSGRVPYYDGYMGEELRIVYGFERYYVPENTGREIEQSVEQGWYVDLRVSGSGEAVITRLHR